MRHTILGVLVALLLSFGSSAMAEGNPYAIDLNTATAVELTSLKGIGPKKAEAVIAYRDKHGPFESVDQIVNVSGIGPKTLQANREWLMVSEAHGAAEEPKSE